MPSSTITLTAADGSQSSAYVCEPPHAPKGAIVVLQEIFGVNAHIRGVADRYAAAGYLAVAPATFDRVEKGVQLGYLPDDMKHGARLKAAVEVLPAPGVLQDIQAAVHFAAGAGKVGIVGYCWGGNIAWLAASRLPVAATVGYYGGDIANLLNETPKAPLQLHFGELDQHITPAAVASIRAAVPTVPVHTYPAGHGFNCDERKDYDAASADLARERTLALFAEHVG